MKVDLNLSYALGEGNFAHFLDALRVGVARASKCSVSGKIAFPPNPQLHRRRAADDQDLEWVDLDGHAVIIARTDGPEGSYALARFGGADNCAVCRILNPDQRGLIGRICKSDRERPEIVLKITGDVSEGTG